MYLLNNFFQSKKQKQEKKLQKIDKMGDKLLIGAGATVGARAAVGYGENIYKGKKALSKTEDMMKRGKAGMVANHPDKVSKTFKNPLLQKRLEDVKKDAFIKSSKTYDLGKMGKETLTPRYSKKVTRIIKDDIKGVGSNLKKSLAGTGDVLKSKLNNNKGKAVLGVAALGAGLIANRIRKARKDKGKKRGIYNK